MFLWCSVPDEPLRLLAPERKLSDPKVLTAQVRRMLADDRSGLLMDITAFLGSHGIMLVSNSGRVIPTTGEALIAIEVHLDNLIELHKLLDALEMIPAVRAAKLIQPNT